MADSDFSNVLDAMERKVELELRPYGGRVFVNSASPENIDHTSIELKCMWSSFSTLFSLNIIIGDEKHLEPLLDDEDEDEDEDEERERKEEIGWRLGDCPIMLTFYPVDEQWLAESAAKNDGEPILGRLNYYPPIQTADGVVNDKRPTVTAWVGLSRRNFDLIREQMLSEKEPQFAVGLNLDFPDATVERHNLGRTIKWSGEGQLPVNGVTIVWKNNDWSSDYDTKRALRRESNRKVPYQQPHASREHKEMLSAITRLESAVNKLTAPIWLAAGATIAALILRG